MYISSKAFNHLLSPRSLGMVYLLMVKVNTLSRMQTLSAVILFIIGEIGTVDGGFITR